MTLDNTIKRYEQMAKSYRYGMSHGMAIWAMSATQEEIDERMKCVDEYEQLADWLKELKDRRERDKQREWIPLKEAEILLKATRNLLNKQNESIYVLNMLAETVIYYGIECDGSCLIEDIDAWMALYGSEEGADKENNESKISL